MSYDILIRMHEPGTHEGLVCIAIQAGKDCGHWNLKSMKRQSR